MGSRRTGRHRGIVEPIYAREPLLLRVCSSLVENLTLILKTTLVVAALMLVQDLRTSFEYRTPIAEQVEVGGTVATELSPVAVEVPRESALTKGVQQALQCTYPEYRKAHYDECVEGGSRVYTRPQAEPDDTGYRRNGDAVLHAQRNDDWANSRS